MPALNHDYHADVSHHCPDHMSQLGIKDEAYNLQHSKHHTQLDAGFQ